VRRRPRAALDAAAGAHYNPRMPLQPVLPLGWSRPKGYANGMIAVGRHLHVAGQVGWDTDERFPEGFVAQLDQALANFLAVVEAAGGTPQCVARMTVYVTDMDAYRASLAEVGAAWKRRMGRHFPAMALVGVTTLVEPEALVEIEGVAVLEEP
jgi:enamine deaminase RidA (YjgF/YER057c/UK114 family)